MYSRLWESDERGDRARNKKVTVGSFPSAFPQKIVGMWYYREPLSSFLTKGVTIQVSLLGDSSLPAAVRKYFVVGVGGAAHTHYKNGRAAAGGEEC